MRWVQPVALTARYARLRGMDVGCTVSARPAATSRSFARECEGCLPHGLAPSNGFSRPAERAKSPLSPLLADQRRSSRSVSLSTQGKPTSGPARPGSYPPRCTSKCGECTPCSPVHVAVPPGTPVTTEYYPEAWRCKCGNRFFMP
ncbi:Epidermal patterning factor-like protein 6 [Apostasia shenzhenica]|uniref:Epidermal patterning factor-like protein n=1 Tax=Apostasia shenzhenica TaxID=1088818 RepID=A0A2I0A8H7_9ASPA|nr:Epidermal patterning factor-like protein 6 [Apostasia shenzhenica]